MKPKAIAGALGLLILLGMICYFYSETAGDLARPVARISRASDAAPAPRRTLVPAAPIPSLASTTSDTLEPLDSGLQTSITIVTLWADSQAPAAGTSVTLRGAIRGTPVEGWVKGAYTDAGGSVRFQYPEAFDWLVVTSRQPMAAGINTTYERRTGDRATPINFIPPRSGGRAAMRNGIVPLTNPLVVQLERGGKIFGTVRRSDTGQAVPGATVIGFSQFGFPQSGPMAVALSGRDGGYLIDFLPAGPAILDARADPLLYNGQGRPPVVVRAGEQSGPHDIALLPGAEITGVVTMREGGAPIAGATISGSTIGATNAIVGADRPRTTAITGPDGRYTIQGILRGSRQHVMANSPGLAAESATVEIGPAATVHLDFQLGPGGRLEVAVRDDAKNPIEGASVQFQGFSGRVGLERSAKTDSQGNATFQNVSQGPSQPLIIASKSGYKSATTQQRPDFDAQGVARLDFTLTQLQHKVLTFIGLVSDASGNPLPGIVVAAGSESSGAAGMQRVSTGADGTYVLGPVDIVGDSAIKLIASGKGWGSNVKQAPVPAGPETPVQVDFTMEPGHWVAGTVVDELKAPIVGARVSLGDPGMAQQMPQSQTRATTKEDGKFRFEDLPSQFGPHRVYVTGPGARQPVSQAAIPDQEIEIVLKSGGVIRGRVLDAQTKRPVTQFSVALRGEQRWSGDGSAGQPFNDPDGRFTLNDVDRNQKIRLTVQSPGYAALLKEHVEGGDAQSPELVLELTPARMLLISLVDRTSLAPVAGASLIVGVISASTSVQWDYMIRAASTAMTNVQFLTSDANGSVAASEGNDLATIVIHAAGYADTAIRPFDRPQPSAADGRYVIALAKEGSISGFALQDGRSYVHQSIHLFASSPTGQGGRAINMNEKTDGQGKYRFSGLSAGTYSIELMKSFGSTIITALTIRAQLAEGQDLALNIGDDPGPGALFGVVAQAGKPASGLQIAIHPSFEWDTTSLATISDANGEYSFLGLLPGSYRFSISPSQTVVSGSTVLMRPVNETVVVGPAPTRHDYDFQPGKNLTVRFVFPPGFPPEIRAAILAVSLEQRGGYGGIPNQLNPNQMIDRNIQAQLAGGDRVVFNGRLQGIYRLRLIYLFSNPENPARGSTRPINIAQDFTIDNLQADVDLGDVLVPLPPAAR